MAKLDGANARRGKSIQPRINGELLDGDPRLRRADGHGPRDQIAQQIPQMTRLIRGNKMARGAVVRRLGFGGEAARGAICGGCSVERRKRSIAGFDRPGK